MNLRTLAVILAVPALGSGLAEDARAGARLVLAESFGPPASAAYTAARTALGAVESGLSDPENEMIWVEYHTAEGLSNSETIGRDLYYGSPTSASVWVDGVVWRDASTTTEAEYRSVILSRLATSAPLEISSDYFFDEAPALVNIDVVVDTGATIPNPQECMIRAFIYEDEVDWCCGEDGRDEWDRIVRAFLPDVPLSASNSGEAQAVNHENVVIDPSWNVDRLRVVAFVQRDADRSILNAVRAIDAGVLNPVPEVPPELVRIVLNQNTPNPARGDTNISWTLSGEAHVLLRILDPHGRVVRVLNDGIRPEGRSDVSWNGADFRGTRMASGVYVIELATPGGRQSKKLVLLR